MRLRLPPRAQNTMGKGAATKHFCRTVRGWRAIWTNLKNMELSHNSCALIELKFVL
jgi:hypothetical protein